MLPHLNRHLTHWVDGMKIHKQHFVNSENALLDAIRDMAAVQLTGYNYGLLPPAPGDKRSLEVRVMRAQSSNYKISLSVCRAITAGGVRIEMLPENGMELVCEDSAELALHAGIQSKRPDAFYAVLTADLFNREPAGEPAAGETPPRHPYSRPRFALHLVSEDDTSLHEFGASHLPVARFITKGEELVLDEDYIPPCCTIRGHAGMIQMYNVIATTLNNIQEYSTVIVQKVIAKSQNTQLAQNVKKLCERSVAHISAIFFSYRNVLPHQPPIYMAESVVQLANVLKVELDFMPEKEKEELLQYFKEWNEISPAAFEELLSDSIELQYNHNNIRESFAPLAEFLGRWKQLLEKLSELELIGRRKDPGLVLGQVYKEKKKGFSLLD